MAETPNKMTAQNGQPHDFHFERDLAGHLLLVDGRGIRHEAVVPVRNFPITDPDHWLSICDAEGRELAVVKDLTALEPEIRKLLEQDLARREFVPQLRRILAVPVDTEPTEWEVETDRGRTRFLLNSGDDVRRLGPHRALIVDSQGIRYLVDDTRELDAFSRKVLERYL